MLASRGVLAAYGFLFAMGNLTSKSFYGLFYLAYVYKQSMVEIRYGTNKYLTRLILHFVLEQTLYYLAQKYGGWPVFFNLRSYGFIFPLLSLPPTYTINAGISVTNKVFDYALAIILCANDWIGVLLSSILYLLITKSPLNRLRLTFFSSVFGSKPKSSEIDLYKIRQEDVIMLESMGFTRERILEGLRANNNNVEQTIAHLLRN